MLNNFLKNVGFVGAPNYYLAGEPTCRSSPEKVCFAILKLIHRKKNAVLRTLLLELRSLCTALNWGYVYVM
jgi:hypothetical protein